MSVCGASCCKVYISLKTMGLSLLYSVFIDTLSSFRWCMVALGAPTMFFVPLCNDNIGYLSFITIFVFIPQL